MNDSFLDLCKQIVEKFEENLTCLYDKRHYEEECEDVMLYLAAISYLKRYE